MRLPVQLLLTMALAVPLLAVAETRFIDREGNAIADVRIVGNLEVSAFEIRNALGHGPDDFETAVMAMRAILPYFKRVDWRVDDGRRIAVLTVQEHRRNTLENSLVGGFNRAHGFRLGSRLELSRRRNARRPARGHLFAEVSYGFSDDRWNHKFGGSAGWTIGETTELTASAQRQRLTATRDLDAMPNDYEQVFTSLFLGNDFRDYYERLGSEISGRLSSDGHRHVLSATVLVERHRSLATSTDWSLFRWSSTKHPITPIDHGGLASIGLRYEFDGREDVVFPIGWRPSVEIEHASSKLGSDFAFTRVAVNLRRYDRIGDDFVRLRVRWLHSRGDTPVQRQLVLGGPGTLRGYGLYEFAGPRAALFNAGYRRHAFGNSYILFFVDSARF